MKPEQLAADCKGRRGGARWVQVCGVKRKGLRGASLGLGLRSRGGWDWEEAVAGAVLGVGLGWGVWIGAREGSGAQQSRESGTGSPSSRRRAPGDTWLCAKLSRRAPLRCVVSSSVCDSLVDECDSFGRVVQLLS